ncbi:glycosyltransferase family 2 protein [Vibrio alginolyticus]|uniref:glycosyltransferase family 2 protein n=1 Tax=Vibrio alginolyticus TaxID=663 RepID=UPI003D0F3307
MNPKISVIMSAFNAENYIGYALSSLESQTFSNFEIIIINDGSTDNTNNIILNFIKETKCKVKYINQENVGLTKSLNRAIDECDGDFIARMDADDISLPHRFEKSIDFIVENNLDFMSARSKRFFRDYEYSEVPNINKDLFSLRPGLFKFGNPFVHGTFVCKREVMQAHKYNENYRTAQDFDFLCRLSKDNNIKMGYCSEALYKLRVDPDSSGRNINSTQHSNAIKISEEHFFTSKYMIIKYTGIPKMILSLLKRVYL